MKATDNNCVKSGCLPGFYDFQRAVIGLLKMHYLTPANN